MRRLSVLTLVCLGLSSGLAYTTERVVLVIIDGLRYSEGLGDVNHVMVPQMASLAEQGALVGNFQNDGYTYTSRAIPAIWCGAWTEINTFSDPYCNGTSNNTTELPTVFEYYRKQLSRPAEDCVYTLKELCSWKASLDPDYGMDYWPQYHEAGVTDTDVWNETQQIIASQSPRFLLMYLADVDSKGHSGVWDDYIDAISIADGIIGALWTTLQADTAYAGKTTMLITNDHGRHDYNFQGHGDDCAGCRHIQLLAIGPDIQSGLVSDTPRTIPDIAPTIGALLGFTIEDATGTAMLELLSSTAGTDKNDGRITPSSISLKHLYPSPFNAELSIEYELVDSPQASISIFNLQGTQVWTRDVSSGGEGLHTLKWNGKDQNQIELPSGVFIVQLSNQRFSQSQKAILLK
ncbi:MAG: T9SS type A sorting domain-containing protein [Candidatus Marinimicrobia bacterium]|nr:T9SS type A sorting domain-containing protein [Candidatus Neomarinimicrobiota bacterium]